MRLSSEAVTNTTGGALSIARMRASVSSPSSPGICWSSAITSMPPCANARKACLAVGGVLDDEPLPLQPALDQSRKIGIVVDIEHGGGFDAHAAAGGTWMTEKNRPSWRMALAKFS